MFSNNHDGAIVVISVIVPIFNSEKTLDRCLASLAKQDFDAVEFICVDDGSSDNSVSICKKYCDNDKRFKLIRNSH